MSSLSFEENLYLIRRVLRGRNRLIFRPLGLQPPLARNTRDRNSTLSRLALTALARRLPPMQGREETCKSCCSVEAEGPCHGTGRRVQALQEALEVSLGKSCPSLSAAHCLSFLCQSDAGCSLSAQGKRLSGKPSDTLNIAKETRKAAQKCYHQMRHTAGIF